MAEHTNANLNVLCLTPGFVSVERPRVYLALMGTGLALGKIKVAGLNADHTDPSNAEVTETVKLYFNCHMDRQVQKGA